MPQVKVHTRADGVREVGVEGIFFKFVWSLYTGHHMVSAALSCALSCGAEHACMHAYREWLA